MTKDDKQYLNDVASLGCVVCRIAGYGPTPAEIHHPREGQGMSQRAEHKSGIPLCPAHHRGTQHPQIPSIHLDKARFIRQFGTESALVEQTKRDVEVLHSNIIGRAS